MDTTDTHSKSRAAEKALNPADEKFAAIFDASPLGIALVHVAERKFIDVNAGFLELTGYAREDVLGKSAREVGLWADLSERDAFWSLQSRRKVVKDFEFTLRTRQGALATCLLTGHQARLGGQEHIIAVVRDISERKQAEAALRASEERYRLLVDHLPQKVFLKDANSAYLSCNKNYATDLKIAPPAIVGKTDFEFYPAALAEKYKQDDQRIMASGKMEEFEEEYLQEGKKVIVQTIKMPIKDEQGRVKALLGVFWDITERRRIEEQRLVMSKLESVGILAGGIAHDFNNLLTGMLGNIELARTESASDADWNQHLAAAEEAGWLARGLTQRLITLAKGGAPVMQIIALPPLLKESAARALQGSAVKCEFNIASGLRLVEADKGQIGQVIRNLVLNAREAMPEGGTVLITAENAAGQAPLDPGLPEGEYVKVSIADQGCGIPQETLPKIFDPYFSTKQRSDRKGMGLGLPICRSIMQKHGGTITVASQARVGTSFHLYFPALCQTASGPKAAGPAPEGVPRHGRILVMEDEELVRDLFDVIFRRLGYVTELVENGKQAVALYKAAKEQGRPFDGVILDLTLRGGKGGLATLKALQAVDPAVKVIVSSGYSEDAVLVDYARHGFKGVLLKPFQISDVQNILALITES